MKGIHYSVISVKWNQFLWYMQKRTNSQRRNEQFV